MKTVEHSSTFGQNAFVKNSVKDKTVETQTSKSAYLPNMEGRGVRNLFEPWKLIAFTGNF